MNIKPCPCCGNKSIISHTFGHEGTKIYGVSLECIDCGCGMSGDKYKSRDQIIEAWNKRV